MLLVVCQYICLSWQLKYLYMLVSLTSVSRLGFFSNCRSKSAKSPLIQYTFSILTSGSSSQLPGASSKQNYSIESSTFCS